MSWLFSMRHGIVTTAPMLQSAVPSERSSHTCPIPPLVVSRERQRPTIRMEDGCCAQA